MYIWHVERWHVQFVAHARKGSNKRGHIVADTLLPTQMFPRLPARAAFVADTKNVSGFVQKHFVSALKCARLPGPYVMSFL